MRNLVFCAIFTAVNAINVHAAPAMLSTDTFQLHFASDGKPASLRAGTDELLNVANPGIGFSLSLKNAQVPLTDLSLQGDKLIARSANGTQSVTFAVHRGTQYLAFRLVELKGVPASSPLALQFEMNASPRARVLELDYMTQARSDGDGPRVMWNYLLHLENNKVQGGFALYVRQTEDDEDDEDDTLLHIWAEEKLPHPNVPGEWTYERARQWMKEWQTLFADRSQMILEGQSVAELREAIPFAERAQIKEIYLFTNTWRTDAFWPRTDTSWGVNRKVFPRGEDDLKAFSDELRAKGIRLNLHYVSGGIGPFDPLYVAAKPDRRLASWGSGTVDATDEKAKDLVFRPAPGVELPYKGDILGRPPEVPHFFEFNYLRLENELLRVGEFAPQNDGTWLLKNCTRGLFNTKAIAHAAGASAAGLFSAYGQNFVPDNESTLLNEVAGNYADLLNRCGIAHTEYDGGEIHCYSGGWGFEKFATLVYEKLDHPVTSHTSGGRAPRCHFEYRLNSTQRLMRGNNRFTHGNYAVPLQLAGNARVASTILDANFTLSQGNLGGALGISKPEPMFGINAQTLRAHGLTERFIQTLLDWKAISRTLTDAQRTQLNSWFTRTTSRMPEHSNHPVSPIVPVARRTANSGYEIVPTRVLTRKSGNIAWQQGQEHGPVSPRHFIKPGEELLLQNPDAPQTPHFIVRVGWALDAKAPSVLPGSATPAPVSATERLNDSFTAGNVTAAVVNPANAAPNFWLQPTAATLRASGDTRATFEGNALRLSQNNARDTERWETKLLPYWNPQLDMSRHRALGLDISGDGSGATLLLQINGRDYVVPLDFKGRRHVEIPHGEAAWSSGAWGWRMDTKHADYTRVSTLKIGFGFVPPRTNASVLVENLQALREAPTTLQNPIFRCNGGTLSVQGTIASGQYLEYSGGERATLYDENWQKIQDLPVTLNNFTAPTGEVKIAVTSTQTTPLPWLETQFLTEGTPLKVGG